MRGIEVESDFSPAFCCGNITFFGKYEFERKDYLCITK